MGRIDLKFRSRYSPMFYLETGIENNQFITRERYEEKWEEVFKAEAPKFDFKYQDSEK